jgi:hypothetical protein
MRRRYDRSRRGRNRRRRGKSRTGDDPRNCSKRRESVTHLPYPLLGDEILGRLASRTPGLARTRYRQIAPTRA